jgi:hypothetical protein
MDQLLTVLTEIRDQLTELNSKIEDLTCHGTSNLSDIVAAVDGIKGGYDLSDIHSQLSVIDSSLGSIDTSLMLAD